MKRLLAIFACLCATCGLRAFDAELLLLPESERTMACGVLRTNGRADDADLLQAAWSEDGDRFVAVARRMLAVRWDRSLAALLRRQYVLLDRETDVLSLDAEILVREKGRRHVLSVPSQGTPDCSGKRPVVFLHGYGGDASTWSDFVREFRAAGYGADDLLVFQYSESSDGSSGAAAGLTALGGDSDTPIEKIAAKVAANVRIWLRRRACLADDDARHDADLPQADFICHSMGGLVFRLLYADHPKLVRRCVDLGTPHFGQNVSGSLTGYQTQQMKYGSSFLWRLAEDWFFRGKDCKEMIFVVGAGTSNKLIDHDVVWDSLVCAFSATLLTQADGAAYARRTFFVNRVHSSVLTPLYENAGLPVLDGGQDDPVFRLAYGYLNDSHYFADGQVPRPEQVMADDGASSSRIDKVMTKILGQGGLFVQAMHTTTNAASSLAKPIKYDPGTFYADAIVSYLQNKRTSTKYEWSDSGYYWEHGNKSEGCTNGLVLIYGNIPVGSYTAKVKEPAKIKVPYSYPYYFDVEIAGGGTRVVRTRPGNVPPRSSFALTDDRGRAFTVTVPNAWFAETGTAASAEDLAGCVAAGSTNFANGYSGAVSYWLGLDPGDCDSRLKVTELVAGPNGIAMRLSAGDSPICPDAANTTSSRRPAASFVIQGKSDWSDPWRDVTGPQWISGDGFWRLPADSGRLFRFVARP